MISLSSDNSALGGKRREGGEEGGKGERGRGRGRGREDWEHF